MGDALSKLPQDKPTVLYCKVGGRSAEVLALVKAAGFADAIHVGGGVSAWVNQIDPESAHVLDHQQKAGAANLPHPLLLLRSR